MTRGIIEDFRSIITTDIYSYFENPVINYHFLSDADRLALGYPASLEGAFEFGLGSDGEPVEFTVGTAFVDLTESADTSASGFGNLVRSTFERISEFTPLIFREDASQVSDINFGGDDRRVRAGGDVAGVLRPFPEVGALTTRSDIWFFQQTLNSASVRVQNVPHEIAHAVGLEDGSGFSRQFTIASFTAAPSTNRLAEDFQLYDIAALQFIHGSNFGLVNRNDVYDFNHFVTIDPTTNFEPAPRLFSLWDAGGIDRIDASGGGEAVFIDLRPGHFSSIGTGAGVVVSDEGDIENVGVENASIAFGSYIEQATGSVANDIIVGNLLSNVIDGGDGNDLLFAEGDSVAAYQGLLGGLLGALDQDDGEYDVIVQGRQVDVSIVASEAIDVLSGGDGLLALDVNRNGRIDNGAELFGTSITMPFGPTQNSAEALLLKPQNKVYRGMPR